MFRKWLMAIIVCEQQQKRVEVLIYQSRFAEKIGTGSRCQPSELQAFNEVFVVETGVIFDPFKM